MKARIERERIPPGEDPQFHLKLGRGSLSDIEFTVQLEQLAHGARASRACATPSTLARARRAGRHRRDRAPRTPSALRESYVLCERARNYRYLLTGSPSDALPGRRRRGREARAHARLRTHRPQQTLRDDYRRVTRRAREVVERVFYGREESSRADDLGRRRVPAPLRRARGVGRRRARRGRVRDRGSRRATSVLDAGCGTGRVGDRARPARRAPSSASTSTRRCSRPRAGARPTSSGSSTTSPTLDLGRSFDVVVMAGNVPLFTPAGTHGGARRRLRPPRRAPAARSSPASSSDRGYALADYDADCRAAGLELAERYATWDGDEFADAAGYAVSVHRPRTPDPRRIRTARIRPGDRASTRCGGRARHASSTSRFDPRNRSSWPPPSPVGPLRPSASAKPALPTSRSSAASLARAFTDDPVFSWVVPDEGRRRRMLPTLFALFANAVRHHDAMYIAGGAVAAALWVPAGQPAMAEGDGEAFGALVEEVCGPDANRVFEVERGDGSPAPGRTARVLVVPRCPARLAGQRHRFRAHDAGARAVRRRRQGGVPRGDQPRERAHVRATRLRCHGRHRRARRCTALPDVARTAGVLNATASRARPRTPRRYRSRSPRRTSRRVRLRSCHRRERPGRSCRSVRRSLRHPQGGRRPSCRQ